MDWFPGVGNSAASPAKAASSQPRPAGGQHYSTTSISGDVIAKRLQLVTGLIPNVARIAILVRRDGSDPVARPRAAGRKVHGAISTPGLYILFCLYLKGIAQIQPQDLVQHGCRACLSIGGRRRVHGRRADDRDNGRFVVGHATRTMVSARARRHR